jgi:hypothetical protein
MAEREGGGASLITRTPFKGMVQPWRQWREVAGWYVQGSGRVVVLCLVTQAETAGLGPTVQI